MHEHFANWYRLATTENRAEILENRWMAIENFNSEIDKDKALELVRLFFGLPSQNPEIINHFRTTFKNEDSAFLMKDNDQELQILAASSLMDILSKEYKDAEDVAALAIVTSICQGLKRKVILPDLIDQSYNYIANESIRVRKLNELTISQNQPKEFEKSLNDLKTALESTTQPPPIKDPLINTLKKLQQTQNDFIDNTDANLKMLHKAIKLQREEANIHWWIFGEFSRDLEVPFNSLPLGTACLVMGKELADLTEYLPSAYAAKAFLNKAISTATKDNLPEKINVAEIIGSMNKDWRQLLKSSDLSKIEDFCPIHLALSKLEEHPKISQWSGIVEKQIELKLKQDLSPVLIALQFYYERMLLYSI